MVSVRLPCACTHFVWLVCVYRLNERNDSSRLQPARSGEREKSWNNDDDGDDDDNNNDEINTFFNLSLSREQIVKAKQKRKIKDEKEEEETNLYLPSWPKDLGQTFWVITRRYKSRNLKYQ